MRHLLALLDRGTLGTLAEPTLVPHGVHGKNAHYLSLVAAGTLGTRGTLETDQLALADDHDQRLADLIDAYHERIAIVKEAGDIGEARAEETAALEVGRQFVRMFLPSGAQSDK